MTEIVFLNDALMAREHFDTLPDLGGDRRDVIERCKRMKDRLCRAKIERDGERAWHALAFISIDGAERITAARVKFGHYRRED